MYWTAVPVSCRPGRGLRITTRGWDGRLFPFSFPALLKSGRFFHLKMRIDYPHEISGGGTPLEIIRRAHFHCFHVTVDVKRPGDHEDRHPWVHLKRPRQNLPALKCRAPLPHYRHIKSLTSQKSQRIRIPVADHNFVPNGPKDSVVIADVARIFIDQERPEPGPTRSRFKPFTDCLDRTDHGFLPIQAASRPCFASRCKKPTPLLPK